MGGVTLRSSVGRAAVVTQQVYGVFNRFRNRTPRRSRSPSAASATSRIARPGRAGPARRRTIESGVHLQWLGGSLDEYRYLATASASRAAARRRRGRAGRLSATRLQPHRALTISPGIRVDRFGTLGRDAGLAVDAGGARPARPLPRRRRRRPLPPVAGSVPGRRTRSAIAGDAPSGPATSTSASARRSAAGAGRRPSSIATRTTCCSSRTRRTRLIDGRPSGPSGPPLCANALDGRCAASS